MACEEDETVGGSLTPLANPAKQGGRHQCTFSDMDGRSGAQSPRDMSQRSQSLSDAEFYEVRKFEASVLQLSESRFSA
jgi:hypothetical protein